MFVFCEQVQVGGKKTNIVLQQLQPDTPYAVTVAAVYPSGASRDISGEGKTSKKLPSTSTLTNSTKQNTREFY